MQEAVIDLYTASAASGGSMLNEAERSDWWLMQAFGRLREVDERIRYQQLEMIGLGAAWQKMQNGG